MIKQVIMYMTDSSNTPAKEDVQKILGYEGINVVTHVKKHPVTIIFEHEKKLTLKKLGLESPWVVGPQQTYQVA